MWSPLSPRASSSLGFELLMNKGLRDRPLTVCPHPNRHPHPHPAQHHGPGPSGPPGQAGAGVHHGGGGEDPPHPLLPRTPPLQPVEHQRVHPSQRGLLPPGVRVRPGRRPVPEGLQRVLLQHRPRSAHCQIKPAVPLYDDILTMK